jgi:hypothetical protein
MATSSKGPEVLTGTREGESVSRREALITLGLTGLLAVTAACSTSKPELPHEQQEEPMPPEYPSHDTPQGVVTCDRKKGLIRVVDPKEAQRDSKRYSLRTEDCWKEGTPPSNVDPLPPAAPASPTNTPSASK